MWVYSQKDIPHRLKLGTDEGFWLDYWLFLHADETHAIWHCRPLGLQSLASMSRDIHPTFDLELLKALAIDLDSYQRLVPYLDPHPPAAWPLQGSKSKELSKAWVEWLDAYANPSCYAAFLNRLCEGLVRALHRSDLGLMAFLTRRLSSEMADSFASPRSLLQRAKHAFLNEPSIVDFGERLSSVIEQRLEAEYLVRFSVSPVGIPGTLARSGCGPPSSELAWEKDDSAVEHRRTFRLTGITSRTKATDREQALLKGLRDCREVLTQLRVRHYVRTHLVGAAAVVAPDGSESYLALEQPFWSPKSDRRKVPTLAVGSVALWTPDERVRLTAMRGHVSRAVSNWPEDIHGAASEVWQALESFAGGRSSVFNTAVEGCIKELPWDLVDYLVAKFCRQTSVLTAALGHRSDWFFLDPKRFSLAEWLDIVFNKRSWRHYSKWRNPPAPTLLFDSEVGLLKMLEGQLYRQGAIPWLRTRLELDLRHLYAMRNAMVHKGVRIGNDRWASHLARVGLECLFSIANARSRHSAKDQPRTLNRRPDV
jgi:hypothetical protein